MGRASNALAMGMHSKGNTLMGRKKEMASILGKRVDSKLIVGNS
jgi:hypothetical protein